MVGVTRGGGALVGIGAGGGGDTEAMAKYRSLMRRARYLPGADQSLLKLAWEGEYSSRELGLMFGLSAGNVCRRVRKLMTRLSDPVVVALTEYPVDLPEVVRRVGILRMLVGLKARGIAQEVGQSEEEVKRMLEYVRGWAEVVRRVWRWEGSAKREEVGDEE